MTGPRELPILMHERSMRSLTAVPPAKSQTRRGITRLLGIGAVTEFGPSDTAGYDWHARDRGMLWNDLRHDDVLRRCPYGQPGDLLFVRERFWEWGSWRPRKEDPTRRRFVPYYAPHMKHRVEHGIRFSEEKPTLRQYLHGPEIDWHRRPGIFLPKPASRIWLRVTDVRVERVQEISEEDCIAEGVRSLGRRPGAPYPHFAMDGYVTEHDAPSVFAQLWDDTNGHGAWERNDWVWVVTFEKAEGS